MTAITASYLILITGILALAAIAVIGITYHS